MSNTQLKGESTFALYLWVCMLLDFTFLNVIMEMPRFLIKSN